MPSTVDIIKNGFAFANGTSFKIQVDPYKDPITGVETPSQATNISFKLEATAGITLTNIQISTGSYNSGLGIWTVPLIVSTEPQYLNFIAVVTNSGLAPYEVKLQLLNPVPNSNVSDDTLVIHLGGLTDADILGVVGSLVGPKGDTPEHQWTGTQLRFQNADATWGSYVDLKGEQGDPGATGPAGSTGATGAAGPANTLSIGTVSSSGAASASITGTAPTQTLNLVLPKGDAGDTGMSAYEVWVDEGNVGDEQDFLDSLKGDQGDPGVSGAWSGITDKPTNLTSTGGTVTGTINLATEEFSLSSPDTQLTQEQVQDFVETMFTHAGHTNVTATYNDAAGQIILVATNTWGSQVIQHAGGSASSGDGTVGSPLMVTATGGGDSYTLERSGDNLLFKENGNTIATISTCCSSVPSHNHDSLYYSKAEVDAAIGVCQFTMTNAVWGTGRIEDDGYIFNVINYTITDTRVSGPSVTLTFAAEGSEFFYDVLNTTSGVTLQSTSTGTVIFNVVLTPGAVKNFSLSLKKFMLGNPTDDLFNIVRTRLISHHKNLTPIHNVKSLLI